MASNHITSIPHHVKPKQKASNSFSKGMLLHDKTRPFMMQKICFQPDIDMHPTQSKKKDEKKSITEWMNKKVFRRNSSLVTTRYKALQIKALWRDELSCKLITSGINQPKSGQKRTAKSLCDEFTRQLITPQATGYQQITCECDEWWVSTKNFSANKDKKDWLKNW